jgi:cyanate permease
VVKALFMGIVISLILLPAFLPEAMQPKMSTLQTTYSLVQFATAVIGSIYAYIIWIPLKKAVA